MSLNAVIVEAASSLSVTSSRTKTSAKTPRKPWHLKRRIRLENKDLAFQVGFGVWEIKIAAVELEVLKLFSPTEPPEERGRSSEADSAGRERSHEEGREAAEAQAGCGECQGCSRTEGMFTVSGFQRA